MAAKCAIEDNDHAMSKVESSKAPRSVASITLKFESLESNESGAELLRVVQHDRISLVTTGTRPGLVPV